MRWLWLLGGLALGGGCVSRLIVEREGGLSGGHDGGDEPADDGDDDDDDDDDDDEPTATGPGDVPPDDTDPGPDTPQEPTGTDVIYVNSSSTLYTFDPQSYAIEEVGPFTLDGGTLSSITDIAIDRDGLLFALSAGTLFTCDATTVECIEAGETSANSGGFVPAEVAGDAETLVVVEGALVVQLHVDGGATQRVEVGELSGGYSSSGDVAHLPDGRTVLSSTSSSDGDVLIVFDPNTAQVRDELGPVPPLSYGLAAYGSSLYVFSDSGDISRFDEATAQAIPLARVEARLWGAATHPNAS